MLLGLGVARFAYTPMLPIMQEQAGLGIASAGLLAAVNYMGYLGGALIASRIEQLSVKDQLYRIGMMLGVLSTLMMGITTNPIVWALSRFVAGFSSAAAMLLGSGLILNWLIRHGHRSELGIHFSGLGLGIAGCATVVMVTSSTFDWREQWFLFTGLAGILLIPALTWLPPPDSSKATQAGAPMVDRPPSPMLMRLLLAAYFCAGIGYVVSATFTVAIIDRLPGLSGSGNLAFLVIGLAAAPACIVWDLVARRIGEINALILAAGLQTIGIVLPVFIYELWAAILSAMIFGGTFIGMVSLVLTMAGKFYPTKPAKMMGQMTLAYGSAQILGPAVTGWIGAVSGSYAYGLLFAATVMVLGVILLSVIHHRRLH